MDGNSPQTLLQDLQLRMRIIDSDVDKRRAKKQAAEAARRLWLELEEPGDLIDRIIYSPVEVNLLRLSLDLGLYQYLVDTAGSVSSRDLATACDTDTVLMQRIMRCLAALGHVEETGVGNFAANQFTHAFTTQKGVCGARFSFGFATPAWNAIPAYLKAIDYRNPTDTSSTPTQLGHASSAHFFELLAQHGAVEDFGKLMSSFRDGRAEFLEVYPLEERILRGWNAKHSQLLVDVSGGRGHDLLNVVKRYPVSVGHMTLQDRPEVIEQAIDSENMIVMAHDFFQPQPVKGARAYYMRMVLHDWPDEQCIAILQHLAEAMEPHYSKVLVNDIVMPDRGATRFMTQSDMAMLTFNGAMERDESQWRRLFEHAGLKVTALWQASPESVFELDLA